MITLETIGFSDIATNLASLIRNKNLVELKLLLMGEFWNGLDESLNSSLT